MEAIAYYKDKVEKGEMTPTEALNQVLFLFSVSNQRELLIAYERWRSESEINELWTYSHTVDRFLGN